MPRIRTIKPEAFQSETLAEVSIYAERTFFGLSTQADDRGRMSDKPSQINGFLWAMRGEHTAADTEAEISELEKAGLVCRYMGCDGKRYLHLITWDDHQKVDHPSRSRLPRCPRHGCGDYCGRHEGDCEPAGHSLARVSRGLDHGHTGQTGHGPDHGVRGHPPKNGPSTDEDADHAPGQEKQKSSRDSREASRLDLGPRTVDLKPSSLRSDGARARATRIPEDFAVTPAMVEWARENTPHVNGRRETEKFADYWRAASGATSRKRDWTAAWRYWMRKADDDLGSRIHAQRDRHPPNGPRPSTTDQRVAEGIAIADSYREARGELE